MGKRMRSISVNSTFACGAVWRYRNVTRSYHLSGLLDCELMLEKTTWCSTAQPGLDLQRRECYCIEKEHSRY